MVVEPRNILGPFEYRSLVIAAVAAALKCIGVDNAWKGRLVRP